MWCWLWIWELWYEVAVIKVGKIFTFWLSTAIQTEKATIQLLILTVCNILFKFFCDLRNGSHLLPFDYEVVESCQLGASTRSQIQARPSGMNIYYARASKLVSDFLSLERSLVHTLAQLACSRVGTWAELWTKDRSRYKKSETSFEVLA